MGSVTDFRSETGKGVVGTVDGRRLAVGHKALFEALGVDPADLPARADALRKVFQTVLARGASLAEAFDRAAVAPFVREFTGSTLHVAGKGTSLAVMASFFYGREDVIPGMFSNLLRMWRIDEGRAPCSSTN